MCRCCQTCLEDCYWSCIEEKFCYDETIAHYDVDEDEDVKQKSTNGLVGNLENNNSPICDQPQRLQNSLRTLSSNCHQNDFRREIQTTGPILAPEILAVFANSKIFHEDPPIKSPTLAAVHSSGNIKVKITDTETDQLLLKRPKVTVTNDVGSYSSLPRTRIRIITEEEDAADSAMMTRSSSNPKFPFETEYAKNKRILQLQPPFFSTRPASENDIFTIASEFNRISTTPEVPSVSFANLPKNYMETPTIEKYRESVSLYEIQTAGILKTDEDYSMPRYYRHSELMMPKAKTDLIVTTPKTVKISERLQALRTHLPPLQISSREKVNEIAAVHHQQHM